LLNSPVKVLIDGVNLQVGPLNVAALDKEETRKRLAAVKKQKLRMVDRFIDYSSSSITGSIDGLDYGDGDFMIEGKKKKQIPYERATYMQQWTSKIIDNIEITLKNAHFRYEDSQSIPGNPFSAGITLNSFTLSTCDENWHEKFVARDINKPTKVIRKMAKVKNFGLYWMTKSAVLSGESFKDWSHKMKALIYLGVGTENNSSFSDIEYILHPANNLIVRLIHNERSVENMPKFDMIIESTNLPLRIDRAQYLQLLRTLEIIGVAEKRRQPNMYRPYERPNSPKMARAWWRYAIKMVIKRGRYINLVKLSKTCDEHTGVMDIRSLEDKKEAQELEERMPLRSLVIFRHAAAREMQSEAQRAFQQLERDAIQKGLAKPMRREDGGQRTWMGWVAGLEGGDAKDKNVLTTLEDNALKADKQSDNLDDNATKLQVDSSEDTENRYSEDAEDLSIASIMSSLEREGQHENSSSPTSVALFQLSLTTSASLDIAVGGVPVISSSMALTVLAKVTTWGVTATVHMRDLLVVDMCTVTPAIKNIIAVKQIQNILNNSNTNMDLNYDYVSDESSLRPKHDSSPSFSVIYENINARTVIKISALPVEIAVNKLCIQQLIGLFLAPVTPSSSASKGKSSISPKGHKKRKKKVSTSTKSVGGTCHPQKGKDPSAAAAGRKQSKFYIDNMQASNNVDFNFRVEKSDDFTDDKEKEMEAEPDDCDEEEIEEVKSHIREGELEIIFEAHAPKIIIPQDSSHDEGYLLLDTGYLKVGDLRTCLIWSAILFLFFLIVI
jgi:anti-sigma28 factor (negative regulator of flagellin synthesis)